MAVKVAKDPNAITSVDSGTQPVHFIPRPSPRWALFGFVSVSLCVRLVAWTVQEPGRTVYRTRRV